MQLVLEDQTITVSETGAVSGDTLSFGRGAGCGHRFNLVVTNHNDATPTSRSAAHERMDGGCHRFLG
ncbi:MAG: hypothetical protein R3D98_03570 [Candidatus Krumholzibacteriia bacterium]